MSEQDTTMTTLAGTITLDRRLLKHAVWNREPACYAKAWVDLIALANDAPRVTFIHNEPITLQRGQLAWSQRSLETRWQRSDAWVRTFLRFCEDQTMILVDANRRRTIITVLNYEVYNPLPKPPESRTGLDTDLVTGSGTGLDTDLEQKGESGIGKGKGEGKPPLLQDFAEVPSEAEVLAFGAAWPGDLSRAIPAQIPEAWTLGWYGVRMDGRSWPKKWREKMAADFRSDWIAGYPKARMGLPGARSGRVDSPSHGSGAASGRTAAQARFELSKELEGVRERLDACHEIGAEPNASDVRREKELIQQLKQLDTN